MDLYLEDTGLRKSVTKFFLALFERERVLPAGVTNNKTASLRYARPAGMNFVGADERT